MLTAFIDTNILLDLLLNRDPYSKDAQTIFWLSEEHKINLEVSAISIINAAYVAHRNKYEDKDIRQALIGLMDFVFIPNTDKQVVLNALKSNFVDFEDATQMFCAQQGRADVIITRNIKDFVNSEIPCVTPTDFLLAHADLL